MLRYLCLCSFHVMAKDSLLRSHDHPAMSKTPTENAKWLPRGKNGCFQNGFQPPSIGPWALPSTLSPFNLEGSSKDWYSKSCFCRSEGPSTCQGWADMVRKLSCVFAENGQVRKGLLYVFCLVEKYRLNWNHFKKRGIKHGHTNSILPVAVTRNIHRLKFTKEPWRTEKWSILNRQYTLPARPAWLWTQLSNYIAVEVSTDYCIDQKHARNLNCKREKL